MKLVAEDVELFYETSGNGVPLMLMHGGMGPDHTYFRPWFDALGNVASLIYYDHRSGGRSSRIASFAGISHDTLTADADRLRAHLGHDRMVLLGHSYGGMLALEYALRYPERLAGLILCCTAPAWDYDDELAENSEARGTPDILAARDALHDLPLPSDEVFGDLWNRIQPLYFHRPHVAAMREMHAKMVYSASAYHLSEILLADFNLEDRLPEIQTPTLIVVGADDWVTPMSQAIRMQRSLPDATTLVFEESGHYPFIEEHETFTSSLAAWLSSLPL